MSRNSIAFLTAQKDRQDAHHNNIYSRGAQQQFDFSTDPNL